ncbi:3-phosphoshikimate 1-carboxyvinyltransferase [Breznakibacter xylanolyticus]|uniref:3-phosphoshikimate 1-carboxyvinyltransferase n=1 Tax=Breznakibacter xylanolyticus TaxID=990 RepID=A0A2W7NVG7_9BACT|nr:3-phosphoshikimate 1-carboxyvinyltransferase [Breznakibacter xylanolyticus]PZX20614.1 3-phosphoshikimate 1-carboxyvinyltransferase [Breznakibacter xylanolyticus]
MQYTIQSGTGLKAARVALPTSKSISNRALIINALAYSPYEISKLSDSDDTHVMLEVFNSNTNHFDIGAAGTSMRFLTAYLSKIVGEWELTGSSRMKQRPIGVLVDALRKLGANIDYIENEGFPPLRITGCSLTGGELELAGNISSQYISAILMIAPTITGGLTIRMTGEVVSKPYIHLTLKLMEQYGVTCQWDGNTIVIPECPYRAVPFTVEGDWSAASYWYEMVALSDNGCIDLEGLYADSYQGDSKVAALFETLGVHTTMKDGITTLTKVPVTASRFDYDFADQPDLAQTFAVTCCMLNVPFSFAGLQTLRIKESDRIYALIDELAKLGFVLTTNGTDTLHWDGTTCAVSDVRQVVVATYKDHRMAMAFAPVALVNGQILIDDPKVVTKSYPKYWEHLKMVGMQVAE